MRRLSAVQWRKSSRSDSSGGACVEIGSLWRKSSHSDSSGGECVEVASLDPAVAVRDSKDPNGPKLVFTATDWRAFTRRVKAGGHDLS
jgi:hypothetical protein